MKLKKIPLKDLLIKLGKGSSSKYTFLEDMKGFVEYLHSMEEGCYLEIGCFKVIKLSDDMFFLKPIFTEVAKEVMDASSR